MSELKWSSEALGDLDRHYKSLFVKNPNAAIQALKLISKNANSLALSPYKGVKLKTLPRVRKWPVNFGKYGFVIHYEVREDIVLITRVYHGRENRFV
ncbi:MAG: type II toxin-antitoxin system RelE/ParE family toxin [Symploca sp. SIO1C4]|uniref:Type II toxin-antitoxin system RelE/ParE family toxin n=1 Tax=Symploca sp. SIO1C4 TaxID=2607765 RepID=A0A6B3NEQ0_9CYAN|nr:type II toxin-antitoxin system RelE/ParE family toxin [Symploca sp. SIO1C4]